jgi:hypothetical protein
VGVRPARGRSAQVASLRAPGARRRCSSRRAVAEVLRNAKHISTEDQWPVRLRGDRDRHRVGGVEVHRVVTSVPQCFDARKYVLYVEGPEARDDPPEIEYAVVNPRTGRRLRLASYESALNYAFDTSGSADRTVSPRRAGTYELRAADSRVAPGRYVVAIGESIAAELIVAIVGALAFGAVFGIAGATM